MAKFTPICIILIFGSYLTDCSYDAVYAVFNTYRDAFESVGTAD